MGMIASRIRYSGRVSPGDSLHYALPASKAGHPAWLAVSDSRIIAPLHCKLKDGTRVAKWAPTVQSRVTGFNPASDCGGNFMPYKYQANNNCYNYACNIATNSFAQPGRRSSKSPLSANGRLTRDSVAKAAESDGLILIGTSPMPLTEAVKWIAANDNQGNGHLVALFISIADSAIRWKGDFHWVRCDDAGGNTWSQKNGPDQVTNYDFTGAPLQDPSQSQWSVNIGPHYLSGTTAKQVVYGFGAWMFVPFGKVKII